MNIYDLIEEYGAVRTGVYNVGFYTDKLGDNTDETQFFVENFDDLGALCKEFEYDNDLIPDNFAYIELVQSDAEILEEFLERAEGSVAKRYGTWEVYEADTVRKFTDWFTMIRYMDVQNEEMRG